jgi:hypothetical protein
MTAVLVALSIGAAAPADATTEILKETFSGSQVIAGFFGSGSLTCPDGTPGFVSAFGSLTGALQITKSPGTPSSMSNGVFVEVDSFFNTCTGQGLSGSGGIPGGFTPPDKKLTSSAMSGSTLVQDFGSGLQIPVSVNVSVVGTGNLSQSKDNSQSKTVGSTGGPLSINHSHFANSNRSGTATGTITIDGTPIDAEFFFSLLIANDNSSMSVSK